MLPVATALEQRLYDLRARAASTIRRAAVFRPPIGSAPNAALSLKWTTASVFASKPAPSPASTTAWALPA